MAEKKKPEDFMQRSSVEAWAAKGIGTAQTAVEGFLEMFSALLYREDSAVPTTELAKWLDAYYQLRVNAEKQAEIGKFCAEQSVTLEPVVPETVIKFRGKPVEDPWTAMVCGVMLGAAFGNKRCTCGKGVEDPDEKEAAETKDEGKDEFYKLTPFGMGIAKKMVEDICKSKHERCCKDGHVAGDFICPHESEK